MDIIHKVFEIEQEILQVLNLYYRTISIQDAINILSDKKNGVNIAIYDKPELIKSCVNDLISETCSSLSDMENVSLKIYCAKTGQHKIEIGDKLNAYPEGEITLILKHCQINSADGTAYNFRIRRKSKPLIENCRLEGHTGIRIDLQFIKGSIMKDTLVKCVGAATQRYSGTGRKPLRYYGIAIEAGTTYYPEDTFNFKIVNCRIVGATNGMFINRWTVPKYLVIEDTEFFGGVNDIYAQPNANLRMKMKNCKYDKIELTGSHIKITE